MITFLEGTKTVAANGTPEVLSATQVKVAAVTIQALGGDNGNTGKNTGKVVISVSSDASFTKGVILAVPTNGTTAPSYTLESQKGQNEIDLNDIWIKVGVDGEGVSWFAAQV